MTRSKAFALVGAFLWAGFGCGGEDDASPARMSTVPSAPALAPGMAMLQGRVLGADKMPIAAATVTVLDTPAGETPRTATAGADGTWQLVVPGNSSVTLRVDATDFAPTYSNTVHVPTGQSSTGMDLMLVPATRVTDLSNLMGGARVAEYGVIGVKVHSLSGACDPTGGKVTINPTPVGRVFYGMADQPMPDPNLATMQAGAHPSAWVLGVLPSGAYYNLKFEKAGCTQKTGNVVWGGRTYTGNVPVRTKALSYGMLFVE
jgi:Carboxypeptidase regulatory-like domain